MDIGGVFSHLKDIICIQEPNLLFTMNFEQCICSTGVLVQRQALLQAQCTKKCS